MNRDAHLYPRLLKARDELEALRTLLQCILESGRTNGPYLEILGCLLSIDFDQRRWTDFCNLREAYLEVGGDFSRTGWARATRVYATCTDRPTKPSYRRRLVAFPDKPRRRQPAVEALDQIEKISTELSKKPGLSNLSFVILRPADLYDQFRPGYVPCAIAGDFKLRGDRIDLNVMFRTLDALALGYADVYYMRQLQSEVLSLAKGRTTISSLKNAEIGLLNLYLCRTYIQRTRVTKSGERLDGLKAARALVEFIKGHQLPGRWG